MEKIKMNSVVLVGRLVADPELKEVGEEGKVVNFTIAVQRPYKTEDKESVADFIGCNVWNQMAVNMNEYCHKGDLIAVEGNIQSSSFEDKEGVKRYKTDVRVNRLTFLATKKASESDGE